MEASCVLFSTMCYTALIINMLPLLYNPPTGIPLADAAVSLAKFNATTPGNVILPDVALRLPDISKVAVNVVAPMPTLLPLW